MLYSIKPYDKDFLRDFYTQEKILVPESFVNHWKPQLRGVDFVPEPELTELILNSEDNRKRFKIGVERNRRNE